VGKVFSELKEIQPRYIYHERFKIFGDDFTDPSTLDNYGTVTGGDTVESYTVEDSYLKAIETRTSQSSSYLYLYYKLKQPKISNLFIWVKVDKFDARWLAVGITDTGNDNFVDVVVDKVDGLKIEKRVAGTATTLAQLSEVPSAPFKLGISITGTIIGLWLDTGNGWELKAKAYFGDEKVIQNTYLSDKYIVVKIGYIPADGYYGETWIDVFEAYHGVILGLRDGRFALAKSGDTWDYLKIDNKYVVQFTMAGLNEAGEQKVYVGEIPSLWLFDPENQTLEPYSLIAFDDGTYIRGDHPTAIIYDPDTGTYHILTATLALWYIESTSKIAYASTTALDNEDHVLILSYTDAIVPESGYWVIDPHIMFKDGKYYVVVLYRSSSEYHMRLYKTTDFTTFTLVWDITFDELKEGMQFFKDADGTEMILMGNTSTLDVDAYDLNGNYLGRIDIPDIGVRVHPATIIYGNKYYMLAFDRDEFPNGEIYTWGDIHILTANADVVVFTITDYPSSVNVQPDASFSVEVTVENKGTTDGTVEVRVRDHNNNIVASKQVTVVAGSSTSVSLSATAPSSPGTYSWKIEAYNVDTGSVDDSKSFTVEVSEGAGGINMQQIQQMMQLFMQLLPFIMLILLISILVAAIR